MGVYPIVEPSNSRSPEYRAHLEMILASGICPFCPGGETYQKQERLGENEHWIASRNYQPLANTSYHFLFIPKRHVESRGELSGEELRALVMLEDGIKKEREITGSVLYGRDGDPLLTGATVAHLHFQMIVPQGSAQVFFGPYPKPVS